MKTREVFVVNVKAKDCEGCYVFVGLPTVAQLSEVAEVSGPGSEIAQVTKLINDLNVNDGEISVAGVRLGEYFVSKQLAYVLPQKRILTPEQEAAKAEKKAATAARRAAEKAAKPPQKRGRKPRGYAVPTGTPG